MRWDGDIFDGSFMCGRSHDIGTNPITRDTIHGSSKCLADTATKRQTLCFNAASQFSQRFSEHTKWISLFFFEAKLFFCLNMGCYTFVYHFLKGNRDPYAPCIEYLPTFTTKMTQLCRYICQHHGASGWWSAMKRLETEPRRCWTPPSSVAAPWTVAARCPGGCGSEQQPQLAQQVGRSSTCGGGRGVLGDGGMDIWVNHHQTCGYMMVFHMISCDSNIFWWSNMVNFMLGCLFTTGWLIF